MKNLLKNWNDYLLTEGMLSEVSVADAQSSLDSKNILKLIKAWRYDNPEKWSQRDDITDQHNELKERIKSFVPSDIDPQHVGITILWILRTVRSDKTVTNDFITGTVEKYERVKNDLETFFIHKKFMTEIDLFSFKTFGELQKMVDSVRVDIRRDQENKVYSNSDEGVEVFRDDAEWRIYALHNKNAACEHGKGTEWCTAASDSNYFDQYYEIDDPLFYFEKKTSDGEIQNRWQFHYGSEQFMDSDDRTVNGVEALRLSNMLIAKGAHEKYPKIEISAKLVVARAPTTLPEKLAILSRDKDNQVRQYVADNPSVPIEELKTLSRDKAVQVRQSVADNPSTPPETLTALSLDVDDMVRQNVARNPLITPEILATLSRDVDDMVRRNIAANKIIPIETLIALSQDESSPVRCLVAQSKKVPVSTLVTLSQDVNDMVRLFVASNSRTPTETLVNLSQDTDTMVRRFAARNPSTPVPELLTLSRDGDDYVSDTAKKNPTYIRYLKSKQITESVRKIVRNILRDNR